MNQITIKDIAKICGVGVATVSRALNNHPDINQDTKQKVMDVVNEYGFVPNNSARNLKLTESNIIAVLVKGISNPFFMRMISVMEAEIQSHHYAMELRHVDEKTDEVEVAIELVKEKKLKGIIFLGGLITRSTESLQKIGVPFILSTISVPGDEKGFYSSISVDDVAESYKMVDYLIQKGHKSIAFMGAPKTDISIGQLRLDGYMKALEDNNISVSSNLIWHSKDIQNVYSIENGYQIMKEKLAEGNDFTAVYAISDTMALGAIRALSEANKKVPQDVSVVGFDGIDIGEYSIPSLTTISQPFELMARKTTQILFDVILHGVEPKNITVDAKIIERESAKAIES